MQCSRSYTPLLFQHGRLTVRATARQDLDYVLRTEHAPENAPFLVPWTPDQHRSAINDPGVAHWIIQLESRETPIGYLILAGLESRDRNLELKRLVIGPKGKGYGREALHLVEQVAFDHLRRHRLWLDVMVHNQRARHLYCSAGYREEGTLRECLLADNKYVSLVVMSKLEQEYRAALPTAA